MKSLSEDFELLIRPDLVAIFVLALSYRPWMSGPGLVIFVQIRKLINLQLQCQIT